MKHTVVRYGVYSLVLAAILFLLALTLGDGLSYRTQEILGYATMTVSLLFVFFGIKHYRDEVSGGTVSFWKAFSIGILISMFAGIGFGIIDYIYTTVINPDFMMEYETAMLADMKTELSAEEFEKQKVILQQQMKAYGGSGFMAALMFITVVLIGIIISLLSAVILQKKEH
ncbi:DUF4199 domain-containing protein [Luteirhabdus pelagi]|uniref:DUF4199 domain-containing protein n=1 Tax=Luteirhabdus pelagi TaxID=2792783 RepID=UPI0019396BD0|nr:DUF4199 domain-containing protein [Luteirhabdus pelagi]